MGAALSAILSPAVGILISPLPIVGLILILLGNDSKKNSASYAFGWILGNLIVFSLSLAFIGSAIASQQDPGWLKRLIQLVLGLALVYLGGRAIFKRINGTAEVKTPAWFDKMTQLTTGGAILFGLTLSAANPKNALLGISAGAAVSSLQLNWQTNLLVIVIFVLLATSSIFIPTIIYRLKGEQLNDYLDKLKTWLIANNEVIMGILILFVGINTLSKIF